MALGNQISTGSAGLRTTPGKTADTRAIRLATEFGVSLDSHRTERLTPALVESADLILVMDTLNAAQFMVDHPRARHKLYMLGAFCGSEKISGPEIADPYNGDLDDVRRCYQTISQRISSFIAKLVNDRERTASPDPLPR
jgi:protein-tyrosine phosphatase